MTSEEKTRDKTSCAGAEEVGGRIKVGLEKKKRSV
jgi:hypothetical protein